MASLNEQMTSLLETEELPYADDASASIARTRGIPKSKAFYPVESIQKLESWNSGMKQEKLDAKIDENIQNAKEIGTGLATGAFGLPSDILEGVNYINDFMAEQGSPKAIIFKDALNEAREKYGRAAFDKKFTEITGIKSDSSNMNQIIGEVLSPGALIVGGVKGTVKATQGAIKLYDFLQDAFKTQTNLLRGNIPPGGAAQTVTGTIKNTATSNQMGKLTNNEDVLGAAVEAAKIRNINNDNPNQPQINLSEVGIKTPDGAKAVETYRIAEGNELDKIGMGKDYTPEGYAKLSNEVKDQLYKDTGVYRGQLGKQDPETKLYPDGKLRYKISTAEAQFDQGYLKEIGVIDGGFNTKNMPEEGIELKNILNYKDLYRNYGSVEANGKYGLLENIKVKSFDAFAKERGLNPNVAMTQLKNTQAVYSRHEGVETIYIRGGRLSDVRRDLLHEIQHAVQHREGFNAGSSPQRFLDDLDTEFGKDYTNLSETIVTEKTNAFSVFGKTADANLIFGNRISEYPNDIALFESAADKLVKREYNTLLSQYGKSDTDRYFKPIGGDVRYFRPKDLGVAPPIKTRDKGMQPFPYQGYNTSTIKFTEAERALTDKLYDKINFQDYIRERILTEHKVRNQKLMEAEAHEMYIKGPGEVQARKIPEDDIRYKEILDQLRKDPRYEKDFVGPNKVPSEKLQNRIFRIMRPSEKGVLQGQSVKTQGSNATVGDIKGEQ